MACTFWALSAALLFSEPVFPSIESLFVTLLGMGAAIFAISMQFDRFQVTNYGPGYCHDCGYNLTGLASDRYPECGRKLGLDERVSDEVEH